VVALPGCASLPSKMQEVSRVNCDKVLVRHASIVGDSAYAKQPEDDRVRYENAVAECEVSDGDPNKALAMARSWSDDHKRQSLQVTAIASASLKDDRSARDSLEKLSAIRDFDTDIFLHSPALHRYAGQDWYVDLGLYVWAKHPQARLETLLPSLTGKKQADFLTFAVARADRSRAPGAWVFWAGKVKDARLDRSRNKTILIVEGTDTVKIQIEQQVLVKIETRIQGNKATATPFYKTEYEEKDVLELNGHQFLVEVQGFHEALTNLSYVQVLGVYDGHDGERPTVKSAQVFAMTIRVRSVDLQRFPVGLCGKWRWGVRRLSGWLWSPGALG